MKRIKILYTIPNFDTAGSGIALMKLIMGLDKTIVEPHIACSHTRGKYFERVVATSGIPVHVMDITVPVRPILPALSHIWKIASFIRENCFDIVYSYHWSSDFYEAIAVRLAGCKWIYFKKNMSWYGSALKFWKLRSLLASHISVQNQYMLDHYFHGSSKCSFMPVGVDMDEFKIQSIDMDLKRELHIQSEKKIILFLANLVPVKGCEYLLEAINSLNKQDKFSDCICLIVGGGDADYIQMLRNYTIQNELEDKVVFVGKRMDAYRFYAIADLFVVFSRMESGPVTMLEAMASGVISLGTRMGGMLDMLGELPDQLMEPEDSLVLAEKVYTYLNIDPIERKRIILKQLEIVNRDFTLQKEIARHEALYLKLMKK